MHKQKGAIEIVLVLLLVAAIGVAGYFWWQNKQGFLSADPVIKECVENLKKEWSPDGHLVADEDYVAGVVLVRFKNIYSREEIVKIVKDYQLAVDDDRGLDYIGNNKFSFVQVSLKVPKGSEWVWVCKLMQDQRIEGAYIDHILHTLQ